MKRYLYIILAVLSVAAIAYAADTKIKGNMVVTGSVTAAGITNSSSMSVVGVTNTGSTSTVGIVNTGGVRNPFAIYSANTVLTTAMHTIECRRNTTLIVPKTTSIAGQELVIVKSDASNKCFLNVTGSGQISGFGLYSSIDSQYEARTIRAGNGTGWHITDSNP